MENLENLTAWGFALGVASLTWGISHYFGHRSLYLHEKAGNVVTGSYAKLLKSKDCDKKHKIYFLGEPSEIIRQYLIKNGELKE